MRLDWLSRSILRMRRNALGFIFLRRRFDFFWFGFVCDAGLVCLGLRWHPRYGVCHSSVAPVRGGTYFSLPPQRKVGKRKRLTPPARVLIHGPPTSPCFTRHCLSLVYVAS